MMRSRSVPKPIRLAVLERDGYACRDCGLKYARVVTKTGRTKVNLELHHIIEFENGGEHTLDNLVTVCRKCHKERDREYVAASARAKMQERVDFAERKGFITHEAAALMLNVKLSTVKRLVRVRMLTPYISLLSSRVRLLSKAEVERLKASSVRAAA